MTLLFDRLQADCDDPLWSGDVDPVVEVSNVASLVYREPGTLGLGDCPNIAPPWSWFFMEWRRRSSPDAGHWGVEIYGHDYAVHDPNDHFERAFRDLFDEPIRWYLQLCHWFADRDLPPTQVGRIARLGVAHDGSLAGDPLFFHDDAWGSWDSERFSPFLTIPLLSISLSHCKNVEVREVLPGEKLRRTARKRGRPDLHRHHVLEIDPMRRTLQAEGGLSETGIKTALHICRGHFKDYRQRGLFGRDSHRGVYWWPQFARGDDAQGVVTKDYEIGEARP